MKSIKQQKRTNLFYNIGRILVGITFILSVLGMFLVKDDSQRSRFAFNAIQSLLFSMHSIFI